MRAHAQVVATSVTSQIIAQAESLNQRNQKLKALTPLYSSARISSFVNEIGKQIAFQHDRRGPLGDQQAAEALTTDNMMSVAHIQVRGALKDEEGEGSNTRRYHRMRSNTTISQADIRLLKSRRNFYNKIRALAESQLPGGRGMAVQSEDQAVQTMREQKSKCKEEKADQKLKVRANFLTHRERRQKFSFDYDHKILMVKPQQKANLISHSRSLEGHILNMPKKSEAKSHSLKKIETTHVETTKVVEKAKKKGMQRARSREEPGQAEDQSEVKQGRRVQFCEPANLSYHMVCQPGTRFLFNNSMLRSPASRESDECSGAKRYSKIEFQILRSRNKYSPRTIEVLPQTTRQQASQTREGAPRQSQTLRPKQSRVSGAEPLILVTNQKLKQYLLEPVLNKEMGIYKNLEETIESQQQLEGAQSLTKMDEYNMKYIRGLNQRKISVKPVIKQPWSKVPPKAVSPQMPYLKARERVLSKYSVMSQARRKFEQSLRSRPTSILVNSMQELGCL